MGTAKLTQALGADLERCLREETIRARSFYPEFCREWRSLLERAGDEETVYFDPDSPSCYTLHSSYEGIDFDFHIDQLKIADWYLKEVQSRKRVVFFPKKLRRRGKGDPLMFHEVVCRFDPDAPESALTEDIRNIMACALPAIPAQMAIVYGNKWVEGRFNVLRRHSLQVFLIGTDYVPAFLATPLEICLYLFWMDCCIIRENAGKMPDTELRGYLHIFRPSPMLRIKGLL